MADVAEKIGRTEVKLGIILSQLDGICARINSLALQRVIFVTIAALLAVFIVVFTAAWLLPPLGFLIIGAVAAVVSMSAVALVLRSAWRMRLNRARAAALADESASMNGRLSTLAAFAAAPTRPALWQYLVEDALLRRERFTPARIEPRRLSRSVFAPLLAAILALLTVPGLPRVPRRFNVPKAPQKPVTLDLRDLTIDPSVGQTGPGAEVTGDAATMRKLDAMIARARIANNSKDPLSRMLDSARHLGSRLQSKITGGLSRPPARIKLTDSSGTVPPVDDRTNSHNGSGNADNSHGRQHDAAESADDQTGTQRSGHADTAANQQPGNPGAHAQPGPANEPGRNSTVATGPNVEQWSSANRNGGHDGGGASHGAGADPGGLYGKAEQSSPADGSFQIAIEAHPAALGDYSGDANRAPKVEAALNPIQHNDEPMARTAVPPADRETIERIFER